MKLKKKMVKWGVIASVFLIFALIAYSYSSKPTYDNIITPKPVYGNPDGAVEVIEFGDIQCPACGSAHPIITQIKNEFKEDINFQFYHMPLRQIHPYAQKAAEAAECANDQGKFFEYIDIAYANQHDLSKGSLKDYAEQIGLDTESFNACLDSGAKKSIVDADYREGVRMNVQGTPTFFINGQELDGWDYNNFKATIEAELG